MFPLDVMAAREERGESPVQRKMVWIYRMVRMEEESDAESSLGLKILFRRMEGVDGVCFGGNHVHVCIVFVHVVYRLN